MNEVEIINVLLPVAAGLADPLIDWLNALNADPDSREAKIAFIKLEIAAKKEALKKLRND